MIDHINEKCSYVNSATIISVDGISAQMYGLWLKAKHSGSLLFMNSLAEEAIKQDFGKCSKFFELQHNQNFLSKESLNQRLERALIGEDKTDEKIQNVVEMSGI